MIVMYGKFAQLLTIHKITANTVAKAVHANASTFTDWKQGKCQPKLEKLQKIANYFNVPVSYFLDDDTATPIAKHHVQTSGVNTDSLDLKSLDEQTMYVLKEFQNLNNVVGKQPFGFICHDIPVIIIFETHPVNPQNNFKIP